MRAKFGHDELNVKNYQCCGGLVYGVNIFLETNSLMPSYLSMLNSNYT